ncbi:MAG: hypothetical protein E6Q98_16005 [Rhodospirillaceae bacterium]|nr:MAG: hypothetical protein E6Q98_16005 [Rhodospirillaceae bacterium]
MKLTIPALIEALREAAKDSAELIDFPVDIAETIEGEAADLIEELVVILEKVRDGDPGAVQLARDALDPQKRILRGIIARG